MGPSPSHGRVGERDAGHASLKVYEPVAERYLSFSLPREKDDWSVLGSWVKTMRDAVRNKEGGKDAVRLPKILVLASGLLHARQTMGIRMTLLTNERLF